MKFKTTQKTIQKKLKRKKKNLIFISIFIILSFFLIPLINALGITPAKYNLKFTTRPQTITYKIINNEHRNLDLMIYAEGILRDYIEFSTTSLKINEDTPSKEFKATIKLPKNLPPGTNVGKIVVEEKIPSLKVGETFVNVKLRVIAKIFVEVKVSKYIEASLNVENEKLITEVSNKGSEDIEALKVNYFVLKPTGEKINLETKEVNLFSGQTKELEATLPSLAQGSYSVVALIRYDENELELSRNFTVGSPKIKILSFNKYFPVNRINKFEIKVKNEWNQPLNVYANIAIKRESLGTIKKIETITEEIQPYKIQTLVAYLDTEGLDPGKYDVAIRLYYLNESSTILGEIKVFSFYSWKYLLPVFLIVFFVLFLKRAKKHKKIKKDKKQKSKSR